MSLWLSIPFGILLMLATAIVFYRRGFNAGVAQSDLLHDSPIGRMLHSISSDYASFHYTLSLNGTKVQVTAKTPGKLAEKVQALQLGDVTHGYVGATMKNYY
jgi:hypothetical protein